MGVKKTKTEGEKEMEVDNMNKTKAINIISIPGAMLFVISLIYSNYQVVIGHGSETIPTWVVYLFIYSVISFIVWVVTHLIESFKVLDKA